MATPSLAMIPSAIADAKVYSVLPNNGDGDFTFNRDSSATRIGQNGLIQTVGYFGNDIVLNGDFSNGSTNWALNSNWSVANNKATADGTSNSIMFQSNVLQDNTLYLVSYTLSNFTQGSININLSGVSGVTRTTNGTYTEYVTSGASPSGRLDIQGSGSFIVSITNISIKEVTGDQPRLNYDISNGVVQSCPSLLLEPASTNLFTYSEDFSQSAWIKSAAVVTLTSQTAPDGTINSVYNLTGTNANLYTGGTTAVEYTISFYIKSNGQGKDTCKLRLGNSISSQITATDQWIRHEFTATPTSSVFGLTVDSSPNNEWDILIWGAQVEALSYATSYIPNFGQSAGVTRAAETCFGAGTSSTFNSTEGVLYAEIKGDEDGGNRFIAVSDGNINDYIRIIFLSNNIIAQVKAGGSEVFYRATSGISIEQFNKIAVCYKLNQCKLFVNGSQVGLTDTSASMPTGLNTLEFAEGDGTNNFYGNTKDIRVYNEALTDAQLQTLTTL